MEKKQISKTLLRTICITIALMIILLTGSIVLQQTKKSTCGNIMDVWEDVGTILSQRDGTITLVHNLQSFWLYISSNTIDGVLYEWRELDNQGLIPSNLETKQIVFTTRRSLAAVLSGTNEYKREIIFMTGFTHYTEFYNNPNELDYTETVNIVEIEGWAIYPKDSNNKMIGYTSNVIIGTYVTDSHSTQNTIVDKREYKGKLVEYFDGNDSFTDQSVVLENLDKNGTCFDFGIQNILIKY